MSGSKSWNERRWRRTGLHALGLKMEEYDKYLETAHWQQFRKLALDNQLLRHGRNFCQHCPAADNTHQSVQLHVHHLTYERLGIELLEDVEIVCRPCHEKIHLRDAQSRKRNYAPGYR